MLQQKKRNLLTACPQFRKTGASCNVDDQLNDLENARYRALAPAALMHCGLSTFELESLSDTNGIRLFLYRRAGDAANTSSPERSTRHIRRSISSEDREVR